MKNIILYFQKAPIIFPLLGIFLVFLTGYEISIFWIQADNPTLFNLRPLVFSLYSIAWIACCYLKKWGAISFIAITSSCLGIYHLSNNDQWQNIIGEILYKPLPLNVLMCMLVLLFYKKFK